MDENLVSTAEAAKILGISRVAVFNRIKKGEIKAWKVGRNYVVDKRSLGTVFQDLTPSQKERVEAAVDKVVKDFGPALRRLAGE